MSWYSQYEIPAIRGPASRARAGVLQIIASFAEYAGIGAGRPSPFGNYERHVIGKQRFQLLVIPVEGSPIGILANEVDPRFAKGHPWNVLGGQLGVVHNGH